MGQLCHCDVYKAVIFLRKSMRKILSLLLFVPLTLSAESYLCTSEKEVGFHYNAEAKEWINGVFKGNQFLLKPIDAEMILSVSSACQAIITVEDHYAPGGLGEAVKSIDNLKCPVYNMTVDKIPRSGTPAELLEYEEISKKAIIAKIRGII